MIVYPDTSFILSLWHTGDSNYAEALKLFSKLSRDSWLWCDLHQLEVPIAAQVATHREPVALQEHVARTIVFRAERAVTRGGFLRKALPRPLVLPSAWPTRMDGMPGIRPLIYGTSGRHGN